MGHLDISMRLAGSGAEPAHGLAPRGEGLVRPGGGRSFPGMGRDNFGEALPLAPGACPEQVLAEELEMLAPECFLVELGEEEVTEPRPGAELPLEETTQEETAQEETRQGWAPRPRAPRPRACREPEGTGAEGETFKARQTDLPSRIARAPEVRVARRVGSARCEELAQHLDEGLRGLGLQVRLAQLPRAERVRQRWSLFLEYAQAAAQQGPVPREVRKALEQVLVRHGFQALRGERSGQSGVALARWVLQSRSPEQVLQRGEAVRLELCLEPLAAGVARRGTGLLPVWLRQLGQQWAPPVLVWVQQVRTALAERLPRREGAEAGWVQQVRTALAERLPRREGAEAGWVQQVRAALAERLPRREGAEAGWVQQVRTALAERLPRREGVEAGQALVRLPAAWVPRLAGGARVQEHVPRLAEGLREFVQQRLSRLAGGLREQVLRVQLPRLKVAERAQVLTQGLRQPGLGAPWPRLARAQGAVQLWSERVLAPVQVWSSRAREALQQALPRPALAAIPARAQARVMELPVAQPAWAGQAKVGQAEQGQVELAAQNLAEGLRRIEVRAERVELPRPERLQRMWNAFLQHAQAAVAEGASPRRLREAFEPVLVRHGFQELRDAGTERSGVSAALWVLLGGTPEQVRERGAEVRLEPGAVERRTQTELAATQPELALVEGGRAREAQQAAEPVRARWGWLPSWVPLEPALQFRPPRPGEEEPEPPRQRSLQGLRRSLLWGALERFRALPGQGALERSEWNRKVFLSVAGLLGLWVATTLLLYAL